MRPWFKSLWAACGGIWAAALLMTGWNHLAIESIKAAQAEAQTLETAAVFQSQNRQRLERLRSAHAELSLPVDSAHLGVLTVRSLVADWSLAFDLPDAKMTVVPFQKESDTIRLKLVFTAPFEKAADFLTVLDRHRYLQEKQMVIKAGAAEAEAQFELTLALKYRLKTGGEEPENLRRQAAL